MNGGKEDACGSEWRGDGGKKASHCPKGVCERETGKGGGSVFHEKTVKVYADDCGGGSAVERPQ